MAYYYQPRRRSIFGGILLILIGLIFLAHEFRPDIGIARIFERYWPLLLVIWGLALLFDHLFASRRGAPRASAISGGEIALIIILLIVVAGFAGVDWARRNSSDFDFGMDGMFDHSYNWKTDLPAVSAKASGAISILTDHGNITVSPASDSQIHVNVDKIAQASSEDEARQNADNVRVKITPDGDGYRIEPQVGGGRGFESSSVRTDLTVLVPPHSPVNFQTNHGDIRASDLNAPLTLNSKSGDLELYDVQGDIAATMAHGDTRMDTVKGNVRLDGRGGEVDLSNVTGDATIDGDFYGPIRARNIGKTTRFTSSVSNLTLGKLSGEMELDSGDLSVTDSTGSFTLTTANKDVTLEDIKGRIDLTDRRGDINVRFAQTPRDDVRIADEAGNIDITLPARASFTISAISRNGEIQNDFENSALKSSTSGRTTILQGSYGNGGPRITLSTTYGTISIHKAE
ncbi:MAG TPA: DUF4097 family beta strand repeat-containing protein [Candidatus Acidoferrales bacterium]|nr:DUF4097 family beta strand repeat-containing protein [Candidatus Acidoferrales bacterium]